MEKLLEINENIEKLSEKNKQLECSIELNKRLTQERIAKELNKEVSDLTNFIDTNQDQNQNQNQNDSTENNGKILIDILDEHHLKVHGKTYDYRHHIKQVTDANWMSSEKMWKVPKKYQKDLLEILDRFDVPYSCTQLDDIDSNSSIVVPQTINDFKSDD